MSFRASRAFVTSVSFRISRTFVPSSCFRVSRAFVPSVSFHVSMTFVPSVSFRVFRTFVPSVSFHVSRAFKNQFSFFYCFVVYTHNTTYHVLLLLLTIPMYIMLFTKKQLEHTISCCYCSLYPCRVRYNLLQTITSIAQENTTNQTPYFGKGLVTASFELCNNFSGVRTLQT